MSFSEELADILGEQIELLKEVEELAADKTDIIVANDVEALDRLTPIEEDLINKLGLAEEKRLQLMDSWGLDTNTPMAHILDKMPEGREDLEKVQYQLVELLANISERNNLNQELIEDNLQWLDFNMNLITNTQASPTYGKGEEKKKLGDSLFDRKV